MEEKYKKLIAEYYKDGVSLAGTVSLLYMHGFKGLRYMELRKIVQKERQRLK